ncbi:MAG: baseplate J/gp47 family protein, partial [Candidatus Thorarchaeota archaeon]
MSLRIPTTQQIFDRIISNFEVALGQTIPEADKAFIRVLAGVESLNFTTLAKYASERSFQNFALTATGKDLDIIGIEYDVIRKAATATKLRLTAIADGAYTVEAGSILAGDDNGVRYLTDSLLSGGAGNFNVEVTSATLGSETVLEAGATLQFEGSITNVQSEAVVFQTTVRGEDVESDEAYRQRILAEIRTVGGGGNGVDYKRWSEEVIGVATAYPYAGKSLHWTITNSVFSFIGAPTNEIHSSLPPWIFDFTVDMGIKAGHYIQVFGATNPGNNGIFLVIDANLTSIEINCDLISESSGASVTITNLSLPGDRTVFVEGVQ